jgi:Anaphase promoting complex subunit 8 / Cdc23
MNPQSNQHLHHPTYRSPFLSPLTPPAAGNGGGFGRNHHSSLLSFSTATNTNNNTTLHPYSPSSFRVGGPPHQRTPRLYGETPTSAADDAATTSPASEWNTQQVHVDLQTAGNILLQRQLKCSAKFIAELDIGLVHDGVAPPYHDDHNDVPVHLEYQSTTISEDLFLPALNHVSSDKNSATKIQYPSLFQYARTLVELGDYAYAATILSVPSSSSSRTTSSGTSKLTSTPSSLLSPTVEVTATTSSSHQQQLAFPQKPLPHLSSYEIYLRSYALYMAGEKQKEEQILEYQRYADASCYFHFQFRLKEKNLCHRMAYSTLAPSLI